MANLLELAKDIVAAHASTNNLTYKELIEEIHEVYAALQAIEKGQPLDVIPPAQTREELPAVSKRKAFGKDKVTCMICGKEMKSLGRHLMAAHNMKPSEYRKQFDIPRTQPLAAKSYSESRKQMAIERGLGENLAKARAAKAEARDAATRKKAPKEETSQKTVGKKAAAKKPAAPKTKKAVKTEAEEK